MPSFHFPVVNGLKCFSVVRNTGAMAQLVARFHGMEEATGSNPVSSTNESLTTEALEGRHLGHGTRYSVDGTPRGQQGSSDQ